MIAYAPISGAWKRFVMNAPPLNGQRVLVTGCIGIIGGRTGDCIVANNEVRVPDNLSDGNRGWVDERATLLECDIRDVDTVEEVVERIDVVFHEVANIIIEQSVETPL